MHMNLKACLIGFLLVLNSITAISQQIALSEEESKDLRIKVVEKSNNTTSIISDFIQYKHLDFLSNDIESRGNMVFKAPDLIKWEYNIPFKYSVVFKDGKLNINDEGVKSKLDLSSNKAFKSLNNLIIKSVKGDMFDDNQFEIEYFKDNTHYYVRFKPKEKRLKSFINEFMLSFDKETLDVVEVKMIENSEDYTLLKFINQEFNRPISNEVFLN